MGVQWERPRGTAFARRSERALDLGPGMEVRSWMVAIVIFVVSRYQFLFCSVLFQYQPIGASFRLMWTCLVSRYSSMPHGPSSRPNPACLYPPHGASTYVGCMWFTHTTPARNALTIRSALYMSRDHTAAATP